MSEEHVDDRELLYRRVPIAGGCYKLIDGRVRVSSSAFNDRGWKPSVDRAVLRTHPDETKENVSDGIVSLLTLRVRGIPIPNNLADGSPGIPPRYEIDVLPRPVAATDNSQQRENLAHAQIESEPGFISESRFKKLKEALAGLATENGWLIEPTDQEQVGV